jgi:plasmid maintenance system antidote protein VapI
MKKNELQIGEIILQKLEEKHRSITWLAKEIGCDKSNLCKILKNSSYIHYDLIYRISQALDEDFFAYGSQKLKRD